MTTILIIIIAILYLIGVFFFALISGLDTSKSRNLLILIFYPITMWFIK